MVLKSAKLSDYGFQQQKKANHYVVDLSSAQSM